MTVVERQQRQFEKKLTNLRSQWKNWTKTAPLVLPTGLLCCEACDHKAGFCVVQDYVRNNIEDQARELVRSHP